MVARYWWARWDLRGQPDYSQLIVPYPNMQLTFGTADPPMVRGAYRGRVRRVLAGQGAVLGVTFRAGVFRRYLDAPVDSITDRSVPAGLIFGPALPSPDVAALLGDMSAMVGSLPDVRALVGGLEAHLLAGLPAADPVGDEVAAWVAEIAASPDVRRVDQAAARFGVGERRLQRLFAEHVGVGPKWVIRRFRLHEVTERMAARVRTEPIVWAALAADLGYADQAHLVRDFTTMFGEPPTTYAARY
ncbi:helix-turn-helix domain-containing protein [Dactylosporangium sp. CA-233914]|uniref:AraC family transcriptional regulator n=1 Tax=Dactylosporangium sp. CA-233914 TaxID=3239934 RepID=UPI003D8D836F